MDPRVLGASSVSSHVAVKLLEATKKLLEAHKVLLLLKDMITYKVTQMLFVFSRSIFINLDADSSLYPIVLFYLQTHTLY